MKFSNNSSSNINAVWYPDSGASDHVTSDLTNLQVFDSNLAAKSVTVANGKSLPILHTGSSNFKVDSHSIHLKNILHASDIKKSLNSVNKMCIDNNVTLFFDDKNVFVKDRSTNKSVVVGRVRHG